jgi:hypothetical protein
MDINDSLWKCLYTNRWALIWVKDINDIPILVHELLHFTFWAMEKRWIVYKNDISDETFCYFQEYFLTKILEKTKKLTKNKKWI